MARTQTKTDASGKAIITSRSVLYSDFDFAFLRHPNTHDITIIKDIDAVKQSVKNLISHQAKLAKRAALDALVCSPYEVSSVRKIFKREIITPGVQIGKKNYDQKRSMEAKKVKSDWLVIGRAITRGNIKKNIQNLAKELS